MAVTSSSSEIVAPRSAATSAIARDVAPQPPVGCQTPCSYSRNDRIENKLGQLNGDMPRYFAWNENASRTRGSLKYRPSSRSSDSHGRKSGSILSSGQLNRIDRQPRNGFSNEY